MLNQMPGMHREMPDEGMEAPEMMQEPGEMQ
jgi:hypothetical protein